MCDVEIDTVTARVLSLVIYGRLRFFGLLGREDDIIIKWQDIEVIVTKRFWYVIMIFTA